MLESYEIFRVVSVQMGNLEVKETSFQFLCRMNEMSFLNLKEKFKSVTIFSTQRNESLKHSNVDFLLHMFETI